MNSFFSAINKLKPDLKKIRKILAKNPESTNRISKSSGITPFQLAVVLDKFEVIQLMITYADINLPIRNGNLSMHIVEVSIKKNKLDLVKLFIEHGADIHQFYRMDISEISNDMGNIESNIYRGLNKVTLLHVAVIKGDLEFLKFLFERGAISDIHKTDLLRKTPFDYAKQKGNEKIIQLISSFERSIFIETCPFTSAIENAFSKVRNIDKSEQAKELYAAIEINLPFVENKNTEVIQTQILKACEFLQEYYSKSKNLFVSKLKLKEIEDIKYLYLISENKQELSKN